MPATPATVSVYLAALAGEGKRSSTSARALAGIADEHRDRGCKWVRGPSVIADVMRGIRRRHGTAPDQKAPLSDDDMEAMVAVLGEDLAGLRDRAVTAVFTRRDWPFDGSGDISVLEFSGGVPSGFIPVALASRLPIAAKMPPLIHAGFGQTTSTVNDRGTLHAVPGALKEFLEGPARYVATDEHGSICSGDSGGPDYVRVGSGDRLVQVGVHVSGSCDNGSVSVSTDVRANLDWIRSTGARPRID